MPKSALPKHLQDRRHEDFPWPFSYIPRAWTAFDWGEPTKLLGNQRPYGGVMKPIGPPGTWQFSRFEHGPWFAYYLAFTTKGGTHFRIGARYDNIDHYVEWPTIAIKRGVE